MAGWIIIGTIVLAYPTVGLGVWLANRRKA